jgi:hypothetical protein
MPDYMTNQEAYASYRLHVEADIRDAPELQPRRERVRKVQRQEFLKMAANAWSSRYLRRMEAIEGRKKGGPNLGLADTEAKEILVARYREQNAAHGIPADFTNEEVASAGSAIRRHRLDVSSLSEIPSYGPSLMSLWADGKSVRLSDGAAAIRILRWEHRLAPAWARDDERKKKKLPMIESGVRIRLPQRVRWRPTGDLFVPWSWQFGVMHWEVRINDFPEEYMYGLIEEGAFIGDFQEWPEDWDRSGKVGTPAPAPAKTRVFARPAVPIDAMNLMARYQAGECEAVWRDLMALGPEVRKPPYQVPAQAVARETIRRAKHNFELIVQRLRSLDYQFVGDFWHQPAKEQELQELAACEEAGFSIPAAVRIFIEEMNNVWLMGTHPLLCPKGRVRRADPLFLMPDLHAMIELRSKGDDADVRPENGEVFQLQLCAGPFSKHQVMNDSMAEEWFSIELPNAAADAVLVGEPKGRTLVEYLRWSFEWGGFPGWEKEKSRPEKELAFLRDGLLPI